MELSHVRLLVHDYPASLTFWRDTVGLTLVYGAETGTYASFDTGSARLSIYVASEMEAVVAIRAGSPNGSDRSLVQLDVQNLDAEVNRLRARGVAVSDPTDQPSWGIRVAHFRDPEGNLMELAERLPESD